MTLLPKPSPETPPINSNSTNQTPNRNGALFSFVPFVTDPF